MTEDEKRERLVHLRHCNRHEYAGHCKYGNEDCPALTYADPWGVYLVETGEVDDPFCGKFVARAVRIKESRAVSSHRGEFDTYPNDENSRQVREFDEVPSLHETVLHHSPWQPIEIAPKDCRILLYCARVYQPTRVGSWYSETILTNGEPSFVVEGWRMDGFDHPFNQAPFMPTHWMPLPGVPTNG